jgi:hypothetical protein
MNINILLGEFMPIIHFSLNDSLILKKKHPCSSDTFRVLRVGSDIRIVCLGCGRDLTLPREKLEKMIKRVIASPDSEQK